ncbi:ATP-binding protein [Priestia abyssalis]|uniref:ATP-binding protein n=1 Tax=Priestia abyssalis TaxID=1221450 RepID=UPI0009949537|nr:ATP-binding protein [Priestia abyssalis]
MHGVHRINTLTNHSSALEGRAHILYIYNEVDKYIANAISFILEGLAKNEVILFVETKELIGQVKDAVKSKRLVTALLHNVIFMDSTEMYMVGDQFNVNGDEKLISLLMPFLEKGYTIRTWGCVPFPENESTLEKLRIYECNCEEFISKNKMISVCAYNGLIIPAYVQNELMKTHTHFMTDSEYCLSPLYKREHLYFPSNEEMERLRRLEKQNKKLRDRNNHLMIENSLVKLNNELIIQNEQKLRNIIDELPIPTIIRREASILFLNGVAQEQFSIREGNLGVEDQLYIFFEDYDKNVVTPHNRIPREHQFSFKNGNVRQYLVKSIEITYEEEPAILHSFVDITHEKENEMLMIRSEKMNIVGELAASIAHELRNPLTAIKGFFHMLKATNEGEELYYSVIEGELSRIEQISSELLTLAKPHSDNKRSYNIIQLIDDVIVLLTPQANMKNIEIIKQANCEELYLNCENTKMKQVFINLIKNAIDAMDSAGSIVLTIKEMKENIVIQIQDQGNGIPKELLSRIGEPFYTTKEKGTGLGLMVCFQIIESHEGTIHADSKVNTGTTFTITLPLSREKQ